MKNRKQPRFPPFIISLTFALSSGIGAYSQSTDMTVHAMIQDQLWFKLANEWEKLRDGMIDSKGIATTEMMLIERFSSHWNLANKYERCIDEYGDSMSVDESISCIANAIECYIQAGDYGRAFDVASSAISRHLADSNSVRYPYLLNSYRHARLLSGYPSASLVRIRPGKDVSVPFSLHSTNVFSGPSDSKECIPGRYYIPAECHGVHVDMLFDTGAATTILSRRMADRLDAEILVYETGDTLVYLDSLRVGGLIFRNVMARIIDTGPVGEFFAMDAVIGTDLMRRTGGIVIDNRKKKFIFPYGDMQNGKSAKANMMIENGLTTLYCEYRGVPYNWALDTGADCTSLHQDVYKRHKEVLEGISYERNMGYSTVYSIDTCVIAVPSRMDVMSYDVPIKLENPHVIKKIFGKRRSLGRSLIGMDFFQKQRKVYLDFRNMRFSVK